MANPHSFTVSYKPLWKLLIDRELQKQDLRKMTGLSGATIAKLGRDENVTTTVLLRICEALNCDLSDIVTLAKKELK
ncbi:helix-turn-helix domain-containing protein [Corynebacterium silvaticum]|uniref:Helix-turn-helix transcriptional regulator n=1 Tax=Corynebacterium silvaticum TaxID=2320431 RepID=A0A7Y4P815_9CORY|nr:helix-turn-helix transcriptional regulator [Corynebacterium silvaticum]ARU45705.1 helix-turn-helix transcriptional regulator [Corynebacterium silvaticum]NON70333.1 helix-turn-helix transcriptional regulator [Corynebacterium silvaticum]UWH00819.1 helix-turn-helix transcriptional regulator [Corynebacterium silvaticum]UWH02867.1 helix-turn-helix transcriptional regulator [Corynebacterium silvaticum]UWH04906.1 helix-turn-helix transcriptional regulator [Corynebacterium silvaticum]